MKKAFYLFSFFTISLHAIAQEEVATIYTLPVFEIVQTDTVIIGVRDFDEMDEIGQTPNLEFGVYLSNPFLDKKRIEKINLHLNTSWGIKGISVKVYEVMYDTIPVKLLYKELVPIAVNNNTWITLDSISVELPKKGVMVSCEFIPDTRKTWLRDKYGALSGKLYSNEHLINYVRAKNGVWHQNPDVSLKNYPGFERIYPLLTHFVPAINLTLVNESGEHADK